DKPHLLSALSELRANLDTGKVRGSLYDKFDALRLANSSAQAEWSRLLDELQQRLRRDTDAVLHLKPQVRNVATLFKLDKRRMSFQNALLVFLLYQCGGFAPSTEDEELLCKRLGIRRKHIVRRHGPDRRAQFKRLLAKELNKRIVESKLQQRA